MRSALEVFSEWRPGRWPVSMGRWACGWKLPQVLGNCRAIYQEPWSCLEFRGWLSGILGESLEDRLWQSWAFLGVSWRFLEVSGDSWRFLEILGASLRILGNPGGSWRILGNRAVSCRILENP